MTDGTALLQTLRAAALLGGLWAGTVWGAGVYVAGQGFTLEEAVEQALSEQVGDDPFWIVASGEAAQRVVADNGADAQQVLEKVRTSGGMVYACEGDLPNSVSSGDAALPAGVGLVLRTDQHPHAVYPAPSAEPNEALPESVSQERLLLRSCGALE